MWNVIAGRASCFLKPVCLIALSLGVLCSSISEGFAQTLEAQQSAQCFEETVVARQAGRDIGCPADVVPPLAVIMYPERYSDALVEDVLDAFAELSTTSSDPVVRREAIVWLAFLGQPTATPHPRGGIVARLQRVYNRSESRLDSEAASVNQAVVVSLAGKQAERQQAADFLETVVRSEKGRQHAVAAIKALEELGDPGEAALRRLHE